MYIGVITGLKMVGIFIWGFCICGGISVNRFDRIFQLWPEGKELLPYSFSVFYIVKDTEGSGAYNDFGAIFW